MLFLRYLLLIAGFGLFIGAAAILVYDLYVIFKGRRPDHEINRPFPEEPGAPRSSRWPAGRKNPGLAVATSPGREAGVIPSAMIPIKCGRSCSCFWRYSLEPKT
jgi:hypothetical protein